MTEQIPNDQFHASSFVQDRNAKDKMAAMRATGIVVAESPAGLGEAVLEAIG